MTTQTTPTQNTQPTHAPRGNPVLRWIGGRIRRTLRFAFDHPIEAAALAFVLWIALVGLADANWQTLPQNGVTATIISGEEQAFQEHIGVHMPAIAEWVGRAIGIGITVTSWLAALWISQFMSYMIQNFHGGATTPALVPVTPPTAPAPHR